jgi:Fic family protein
MADPTWPTLPSTPHWIWQRPEWPRFTWNAATLAPLLRDINQLQGRLAGKADAAAESSAESELDALLQNIIESSAIEGQHLNRESVRSSLARRLGLQRLAVASGTARTEGLADLMLDATKNYNDELTEERLFQWHRYLFPDTDEFRLHPVRAGVLRDEGPMPVVSGHVGRPVVHFEAPPRERLETELAAFFRWFEASRTDSALDPIVRAGIAHLWFVTVHPFEDGNGRLTRAITDLALAQAEHQAIRFYAMAASIMERRAGYYDILESSQKGDLDITRWLSWFLETLKDAIEKALGRIDHVLQKARFWRLHSQDGLLPEQSKVLNRLLDAGPHGFDGGLSAAKYRSMADVSKATATRHLSDLLEKKCLLKLEGGGRSTRYEINWP